MEDGRLACPAGRRRPASINQCAVAESRRAVLSSISTPLPHFDRKWCGSPQQPREAEQSRK